MKLKVKVNFDFGKMARAIPEAVLKYTEGFAVESAEASKKNIDSGLKPDLEDSTRQIRSKRSQPENPPLKASGALYNSIKQKGNKLTMLPYGNLHQKGFTTGSSSWIPNKKVPARPFISTSVKNRKKITTQFMRVLKKALRK